MIEINFKDNPKYKVEFHSEVTNITFYTHAQITDFHVSRHISAQAQNIYSSAGCTREVINELVSNSLELINQNKLSDVAVLMNNLKYRLQYPVDEDASLKMGLIYTFIQGENPNTCENHWTEKKLQIIKQDPTAYTFFLSKGLLLTPNYQEYLQEISHDYFIKRKMTLKTLIPHQ